jgi:hypothetical protein
MTAVAAVLALCAVINAVLGKKQHYHGKHAIQ